MEHADFWTAFQMELILESRALPQKTPKQKIPKHGPNKTNKIPHCCMYHPTANISWMAFTYANLLALCFFIFYFFFTLNQVLRLLGLKQWTLI